ncbi:unnamed protein product [Brassicogethes aeneus]|uniref:Uncharacterized protein n=1 Tax=Brassicogethes aeneus TaxID=1431903 RepID=A0A9P0B9T6_BRAAE|nr:unnamed protein product [Brassicogethes aeneus]
MTSKQKRILNDLQCIIQGIHKENQEKSLENNILKDKNNEDNISELGNLLDDWENQCEKQFTPLEIINLDGDDSDDNEKTKNAMDCCTKMTSEQKRILNGLQCIIQGIHKENQEKSLDNNILKDKNNKENISELGDLLDDWENQCEKQFTPLEIINLDEDDSDDNEKTKNAMEQKIILNNLQCIIQGIHEENQKKSLENNILKDKSNEEHISELGDLLDEWENQCEKQFTPLEIINLDGDDSDDNEKTKNAMDCCTKMTSQQKIILNNLQCIIQGIHEENQEKSLKNNILKDKSNEENISELGDLLDEWENQCEKQFTPLEIINLDKDDSGDNKKTKNAMDQKIILNNLQGIIQGIHEENQEKSLTNNILRDKNNEENISELEDLLDEWENQCEKQFTPLEIINLDKDDSGDNKKTKNAMDQEIILNNLQCIIQGIHEENQEKSLTNNVLKDKNNEENISELGDLLDEWENQCEKQFTPLEIINLDKDDSGDNKKTKNAMDQEIILNNLQCTIQGIHKENQEKSLKNNMDKNNEENISELGDLLDEWENQCEKQFTPLCIIQGIHKENQEKSLKNNILMDENNEENISELGDLLDEWENQCEKQFKPLEIINLDKDDSDDNKKTKNAMDQKRILNDLQCIIQGIHEENQEKSLKNNILKDKNNEENLSELGDLLDDWENQCEKQFTPLEIINLDGDDSDDNEKTKNAMDQKRILNDLQCIIQGIHKENQEKSLENNILKDKNNEEHISELGDLLDEWENQCEKQFTPLEIINVDGDDSDDNEKTKNAMDCCTKMTSQQKIILNNLQCIIQGIHEENQEKSLKNNILKDKSNEENISELGDLLDEWENQCEKQFTPLEIINLDKDDSGDNKKTKNAMDCCTKMTSQQKIILNNLQCIIQGIHEENQEKSLKNNILKDKDNEENISELEDLLDEWENQCEKQFTPLEIINLDKDDSGDNKKTKNAMDQEIILNNLQCIIQGIHEENQEKSLTNNVLKDKNNEENISELGDLLDEWENQCEKQFTPLEIINLDKDDSGDNKKTKNAMDQEIILNNLQCTIQGIHKENQEKSLKNNMDKNNEENISELGDLLDEWENQCEKQFTPLCIIQGIHKENQEKSLKNNILMDENNEENISELGDLLDEWENQCEKQFKPLEIINLDKDDSDDNKKTKNAMDQKRILNDLQCIIQGIHEENQEKSLKNNILKDKNNEENLSELGDLLDDWENQCEKQFTPLEIINLDGDDSDDNEKTKNAMDS